MNNMRPILSSRPAGMFAGKAIVSYAPARNPALLARESSIAQAWVDFINCDVDFSQLNIPQAHKRHVDAALADLRCAYSDSDVADAQIACRALANALMGTKMPNELRQRFKQMQSHRNQYHYWAVANVDLEIARYYRWWVDHELVNLTSVDGYGLSGPNKMPHITITRGINDLIDVPKEHRDALWGKYEGASVEFYYSPDVQPFRGYKADNGIHWAVEVKSPAIDQIRNEFDIKMDYGYHLTIGREFQ